MRILYPFKNALWALRPAKPLGVLSRHPCRNPKPLPRGEGLCMFGWLCVVQSPCAYTPGIRAGAILLGLPPLVPVGGYAQSKDALVACQKFCTMQNQQSKQHSTPIFKKYRFIDSLIYLIQRPCLFSVPATFTQNIISNAGDVRQKPAYRDSYPYSHNSESGHWRQDIRKKHPCSE